MCNRVSLWVGMCVSMCVCPSKSCFMWEKKIFNFFYLREIAILLVRLDGTYCLNAES